MDQDDDAPVSEYKALGRGKARKPWRRFPPDVARARQREQGGRVRDATYRALVVLRHRYPEEYAVIYANERAALDVERGPLPGDELEGER
jgi:hypothetical protein